MEQWDRTGTFDFCHVANQPKMALAALRSPRLPKAKVEKKARVSFDLEDLRKIFNAPVFTEQERPIAGAGEAAYWRPLIALYAGARLTE